MTVKTLIPVDVYSFIKTVSQWNETKQIHGKKPKQQWETTCSDGITNKVINHHKILNDAKNGLI